MIKIGMIGTGIISDCHFRAISELSDVCLVAISEINEDSIMNNFNLGFSK